MNISNYHECLSYFKGIKRNVPLTELQLVNLKSMSQSKVDAIKSQAIMILSDRGHYTANISKKKYISKKKLLSQSNEAAIPFAS